MTARVAIVSIIYYESEWHQTWKSIGSAIERMEAGATVHYVDRIPSGVGSLAEAVNRGFRELSPNSQLPSSGRGAEGALRPPTYVWFVSNVTFEPDLLPMLVAAMDATGYAAIHPCFASSHLFCQPGFEQEETEQTPVKSVPFVEFTAPIVRADVFAKYPLDEAMPYQGHDLDWGYRVWAAGHKIGVLQSDRELIGHAYIGNLDAADITSQRGALHQAARASTERRLVEKYGDNYRDLIFPQTGDEIEKWKASHGLF